MLHLLSIVSFFDTYIVSVNDTLVFQPDDVDVILIVLHSHPAPASTIAVLLIPECQADFDNHPSPLCLHLAGLNCINSSWHVPGKLGCSSFNQSVSGIYNDLEPAQIAKLMSSTKYSINRLQTNARTNKECVLPAFTCS